MKITIEITDSLPWYHPFSSAEAYFRWHKKNDERESKREDKIDWVKAFENMKPYLPRN